MVYMSINLRGESQEPVEGIKARTTTGDAMWAYGRTLKPMLVGGKTYSICPTIADMTDDGILGNGFSSTLQNVNEYQD